MKPVNEADKEAAAAGEQVPAEENLTSPDTTLTDTKELAHAAADLEKGEGGL